MTNRATWIVLIAGALALAGCGGGGGGGSPAAPLATITTANAPVIASSVMAASLASGELGSFASFGPTAAPVTSPKSARVYSKVTEIQQAQIAALLKQAQLVAQATIPPEATQCTNGGTMTLSGNIANPFTLTANDTIVFDFASCVEGDTTVNGRFSMRVTSFSGDVASGTFSLAVAVTLTSFQVTVDGQPATVNGSLAITVNEAGSSTLSTTVTSSSISVSDGSSTHTLTHYSSARTLTAGSFTLDVSGTLTSTAFSGTVTFATTTLLRGSDGSFAVLGQVVITGANGATVKVIAVDSTFVRLEVDTNGDGTPDTIIDRTWDDLA